MDEEFEEVEQEDNTDPIEEIRNNVKFAEDDYESVLSNLDSLITFIDQNSIHEVWHVSTIEQNKEHFVVLYGNANHLCTCMYLVTRGLVCRHFFSVMLTSDKAMFHISLIPSRWYNEIAYEPQKEYAITVCNKKSASDEDEVVYEHQIEMNFDMLNEIRHTQVFSETVKQNLTRQVKYNQGFGYAKRAIDLALEIGCEDDLNNLLQNWIKKKEKERIDNLKSDSNNENLPNISNPHQTHTKGAPKKRVKSALEGITTKHVNKGKNKESAAENLQQNHP